jgi:hypothetical protein
MQGGWIQGRGQDIAADKVKESDSGTDEQELGQNQARVKGGGRGGDARADKVVHCRPFLRGWRGGRRKRSTCFFL